MLTRSGDIFTLEIPVTERVRVSLSNLSSSEDALAAMVEDGIPKNTPVKANVAKIPKTTNVEMILEFILTSKEGYSIKASSIAEDGTATGYSRLLNSSKNNDIFWLR
jgi:hypothetical protein